MNGRRVQMNVNRPDYADFDAPHKFLAIESIIAKRLIEHPHAICSYSGGSDSDILIDLIERVRKTFHQIGPVRYVFFNTGLEMKAIKDHVRETSEKYGVQIDEIRPKVNIVRAVREYGIPFMSKVISVRLGIWQRRDIPLSIVQEYDEADDKPAKYMELKERYPQSATAIAYLCSCNGSGQPVLGSQFAIAGSPYLLDFIRKNPPQFQISDECCEYCKKYPAHSIQKGYEMVITGERAAEGGQRTAITSYDGSDGGLCFNQHTSGQYRLRPLFYAIDSDKAWYKEHYGIRYSDAYEVYGLKRTGCCGCPISCRAVNDLELIRPYEPNVVKAAWNIFGKSYLYRQAYIEYKEQRKREFKRMKEELPGQISIEGWDSNYD